MSIISQRIRKNPSDIDKLYIKHFSIVLISSGWMEHFFIKSSSPGEVFKNFWRTEPPTMDLRISFQGNEKSWKVERRSKKCLEKLDIAKLKRKQLGDWRQITDMNSAAPRQISFYQGAYRWRWNSANGPTMCFHRQE